MFPAHPSRNAYSSDGEVSGQLVYVDYGMLRDYAEFERAGRNVKGKVGHARYGGYGSGIQPR